ncbi:glucosaminidase domain-containing protein [Desulfuromonas carbonis]|uniref:glucosaminidase domain-containing protein n=1 Tax=Desulfuromonas sp. DDH964 TaxID=1823759 RepID=UPI00078B8F5E|nr:glucosaminidase domain-containing protein [Desulfuromonas sp. DDH964]AMV72166.1 hypothetical protein DBW_1810 [Desulfuromonas sp. DDH964]
MRTPLPLIICLLWFLLAPLGGCQPHEEDRLTAASRPQTIRPASHQELEDFFASHNYGWSTVLEGVPPFILETLPTDLHRVERVTEKKHIFFLSLLPMVLLANEEISAQRAQAEELLHRLERDGQLSPEENSQLLGLQREYAVEGDLYLDPELRRELLERIDVIPPSLVLAQAATESAYGTSRFARRANNLFGEWTFLPGTGLVPLERPEGATYEIRRFPNVAASLHSYLRNINTHWAYRDFRHKRAQIRAAGKPLRGLDLAEGLDRYSTRGLDYVKELREIILRNRLTRLSAASLRPAPAGDVGNAKGLLSSPSFSRRPRPAAAETTAD